MNFIQIVVLAMVQGAAELLPVSSSAHVIVAEKLMGLDPTSPEMTFFLVMLHTGTMFAVLFYFRKRWARLLSRRFITLIAIATACTGVVGLILKKLVESLLFHIMYGSTSMATTEMAHTEIEQLFGHLALIAISLFGVGILILASAKHEKTATQKDISQKNASLIGVVQGVCLPFRGFSRSGATISTGLIAGIDRTLAEEFSFALAVVLTPPVVLRELHRLYKATGSLHPTTLTPGFIGMIFAFASGLLALRWLSSWLENGKWHYFGFYCVGASAVVTLLAFLGY